MWGIKGYKVNLRIGSGMALFLIIGLSGCSTVSVTPKSEVIEKKKVPGSDAYHAGNVQLTRTEQGAQDLFTVQAELIHIWQVEPQRRNWDEKIRKRYFLTPSDREYDAGMDLIFEPIADIFMVPIGLCVYPLTLLDSSPKGKDNARAFEAVFLSVLPGVEFAAWADTNTRSKLETILRNEKIAALPVAKKTETTKWDEGRTMLVKGYDGSGKEVGSWQAVPGQPFAVPVGQIFAEGSDEPFSLELRVGSAQMPVQGQSRFVYQYDPTEIVKRYLASNSGTGKKGASILALDAQYKIDDTLYGNGDGKLTAGEKGCFVLQVKNSGNGSGHFISIDSFTKDPLLQIGSAVTVPLLRPSKSVEVRIPFEIPLDAPDGAASIRFCATDAAARRSSPLDVRIAYAHRERPDLVFGGAELIGSGTERDIIVTIRNRGAGMAEAVDVQLSSDPDCGQVAEKRTVAGDIPPYSKAQHRLKIKFPSGAQTGSVRLGITIHERYGIAPQEYEINIPVL